MVDAIILLGREFKVTPVTDGETGLYNLHGPRNAHYIVCRHRPTTRYENGKMNMKYQGGDDQRLMFLIQGRADRNQIGKMAGVLLTDRNGVLEVVTECY